MPNHRHNITAIVYDKRGKILSIGRNSYTKSHPLQAKLAAQVNNPNAIVLHAEIAALVKLKDWSKAYKMSILRFKQNGEPGLAKPCKVCQQAIKLSGIEYIEYTE